MNNWQRRFSEALSSRIGQGIFIVLGGALMSIGFGVVTAFMNWATGADTLRAFLAPGILLFEPAFEYLPNRLVYFLVPEGGPAAFVAMTLLLSLFTWFLAGVILLVLLRQTILVNLLRILGEHPQERK